MTQEQYPRTPDDQGPVFLGPEAAAFQREVQHATDIAVLEFVHECYQSALAFDSAATRTASELGSKADTAEIRKFHERRDDTTILPVPFHELEWLPRTPPKRTTALLESLVMRFPLLHELDEPHEGSSDQADAPPIFNGSEANDVLVTVTQKNGEVYDYLFNSRGVQAVARQGAVIVANRTARTGQDALAVTEVNDAAPMLTSSLLQSMMTQSYMHQKSTEAQPE